MIQLLTLRTLFQTGAMCAALSLVACAGEDVRLPPVNVLSPESVNHTSVRWAPDGSRVAYWENTPGGWDLILANADLGQPRILGSSPLGTTTIAWSPDGTSLAYGSTGAGSYVDLWVLRLSDGEPWRATEGAGYEGPDHWHPRGDRLAYLETLEGGGLRQRILKSDDRTSASFPTPEGMDDCLGTWSPDGTRIAYSVSDTNGLFTIWLADSSGGNPIQLTSEGFEELEVETWSPDGTELLYTSSRTGTGDIYVLPINGDPPRQLTRDVRNDFSPRWSPDGTWIAFLSQRGRQTDIWVVPAAGGTELRVTDDEAMEGNLSWGPGGTELSFTSLTQTRGLWSVSVADGSEHRLTPDSITVGSYDLSNDGSQIVFSVPRGGGVTDLAVVPVTGGPMRTLVASGSFNGNARWSPDGSAVSFTSDRSGNRDVWVIDATGGEPRQLTDWPSDEQGEPEWAADGSGVYFASPRDATPYLDLWFVQAEGGEPQRITTTGTFMEVTTSPFTPDVFIRTFGGTEGRFVLNRLLPDGSLQVLWDQTNVMELWRHGVMPSGDSIVVDAERPDGTLGSVLVPVHGGEGRWILGEREIAGGWSSDGNRLAYGAGMGNRNVAVLSLFDGSKRQLTETASWDGTARWAAGDRSIVFSRRTTRRPIVTADVGRLIEGGN